MKKLVKLKFCRVCFPKGYYQVILPRSMWDEPIEVLAYSPRQDSDGFWCLARIDSNFKSDNHEVVDLPVKDAELLLQRWEQQGNKTIITDPNAVINALSVPEAERTDDHRAILDKNNPVAGINFFQRPKITLDE